MIATDIKVGMRVFCNRYPGTETPVCCFVNDEVFHHCEVLCVWLKPIDGGMPFLAPIWTLSETIDEPLPPRIALVLKVNHLEATGEGFEDYAKFKLEYSNPAVFKDKDQEEEFLKALNLNVSYANGCWDYAVYQVEPEGIPINVGPGDQIVVYEDKAFGVFAGVGSLKVINGVICVGR